MRLASENGVGEMIAVFCTDKEPSVTESFKRPKRLAICINVDAALSPQDFEANQISELSSRGAPLEEVAEFKLRWIERVSPCFEQPCWVERLQPAPISFFYWTNGGSDYPVKDRRYHVFWTSAVRRDVRGHQTLAARQGGVSGRSTVDSRVAAAVSRVADASNTACSKIQPVEGTALLELTSRGRRSKPRQTSGSSQRASGSLRRRDSGSQRRNTVRCVGTGTPTERRTARSLHQKSGRG